MVPGSSVVGNLCIITTYLLPLGNEEPSSVSPSTALEPFSWVSRTIAAIVSITRLKTDSDILLPETNEYEACYFD
jgi:hypothetical protein